MPDKNKTNLVLFSLGILTFTYVNDTIKIGYAE